MAGIENERLFIIKTLPDLANIRIRAHLGLGKVKMPVVECACCLEEADHLSVLRYMDGDVVVATPQHTN
jgi:hypothetical protein